MFTKKKDKKKEDTKGKFNFSKKGIDTGPSSKMKSKHGVK